MGEGLRTKRGIGDMLRRVKLMREADEAGEAKRVTGTRRMKLVRKASEAGEGGG